MDDRPEVRAADIARAYPRGAEVFQRDIPGRL